MRATQSSSDFFRGWTESLFAIAFCRSMVDSFATYMKPSLKYLTPLTAPR